MKNKNYLKARDICFELMDVIIYSPAVKRKQRLGIVYSNLSICKIYLRNFDKALEYARKAQENFVPFSYDHSVAKEQEFYALFYSGRFDEAEATALLLLNTTSRKNLGDMRYAKYNFLHANVLFKQGKFSEAARILNQKWEIKNDKEHWETELRILSIMTAIELENYSLADQKTENLRKYIQRSQKTNPVSTRNKNILKLLQQVERNQFAFDNRMSTLAELSKKNEHGWQLLSWELVPFHEWVKEKIKPSLLTKMA
jgi:tetratricopeptide (TPR) repeat protein